MVVNINLINPSSTLACAWSEASMGIMEMSLTALNLPQLLMCSFSRRKKFQMKRLFRGKGAGKVREGGNGSKKVREGGNGSGKVREGGFEKWV